MIYEKHVEKKSNTSQSERLTLAFIFMSEMELLRKTKCMGYD